MKSLKQMFLELGFVKEPENDTTYSRIMGAKKAGDGTNQQKSGADIYDEEGFEDEGHKGPFNNNPRSLLGSVFNMWGNKKDKKTKK